MEIRLLLSDSHPCSYLDKQQATTAFVDPGLKLSSYQISKLAELGFRRSGPYLYRPECQHCQSCIAARIPVQRFKTTRSQKRNFKRFHHLRPILKPLDQLSDEHYDLYQRYINRRHQDGDMYPPERSQFDNFLANPGNNTFLMEYRDREKLVGTAVTDRLDNALSSIYTIFDPAEAYSGLGVYAILRQIEQARQEQLPHLYLGYWIKECKKMAYKLDYRPIELLTENGWVSLS